MLEKVAQVILVGDVIEDQDLSGLVLVDDYLLIGSDEGHALQLFFKNEHDEWSLRSSIQLADSKEETDLEAVGFADGFLYAVGSHSRRRRAISPGGKLRKNLQRFAKIDRQKSRERLYRIPFDKRRGAFGRPDSISLSKCLKNDPIMGPFRKIPSKENGIDIEGLTVDAGRIYLGFRGPVLRFNLVPVWSLHFDRPKKYKQLFVDLAGQGIRDMLSIDNGFLLLSGPVNDMTGAFRLWWWDGGDQLPGTGRPIRPVKMLGEIETPEGAKAEGMTLLSQSPSQVDLLLMFDSIAKGGCTHYRVEL